MPRPGGGWAGLRGGQLMALPTSQRHTGCGPAKSKPHLKGLASLIDLGGHRWARVLIPRVGCATGAQSSVVPTPCPIQSPWPPGRLTLQQNLRFDSPWGSGAHTRLQLSQHNLSSKGQVRVIFEHSLLFALMGIKSRALPVLGKSSTVTTP